ncbi:PREDICTED: serine protease inhibitor 3/4-like [Ceratosolen solmsi marchali]|uniref:Serine protease inhibitor 3/4-like n=1 Tax=Ceratosolen solmsi marchali TaxID=326594 RepID=A0AAJ6YWF8_9HYME|nr:PREDICTED: serine protease inhibitor 3/4-like [Ceratosolen solmsi marchali]
MVHIKADDINEELQLLSRTDAYSINLFKNIAGTNFTENVLVSPIIAFEAVVMYGTSEKKNKYAYMDTAQSSNNNIDQQSLQNLIYRLNNAQNVKLQIVNNICIDNKIPLKPELKELTNSLSYFKICELDLAEPGNTATAINNWVDQKTNNLIKEIIQSDDITSDVHMIVLNAVYFQAFLKNQFKNRSIRYRAFYLSNNNKKFIPTMSNIDSYVYGNLPDLKAKFIELPYDNCKLKMTIIIPNEIEGLKDIVANLEYFNQTRLASSGTRQNVYVMLPKFKIDTTVNVKSAFENLGLTNMLKAKKSISTTTNEALFMDKIIQKIVIHVNEEEFNNINISNVQSDTLKQIETIVAVNRPFVLTIIDDETKMTLFIGLISNPVY